MGCLNGLATSRDLVRLACCGDYSISVSARLDVVGILATSQV